MSYLQVTVLTPDNVSHTLRHHSAPSQQLVLMLDKTQQKAESGTQAVVTRKNDKTLVIKDDTSTWHYRIIE